MLVSQTYGYRRPREIAARLAYYRAAVTPVVATKAPLALVPAQTAQTKPAVALTTPIIPNPPTAATTAQIAAWQVERAHLRSDLPLLRHHASEALYHGDGPTWAEVKAAEQRLQDLDDYLILELDPADVVTPFSALADALPLAA